MRLALGGSLQPGKAFDLTAYVTDPVPGQALSLQLPKGVELLQGPVCQPVPRGGRSAASVVRLLPLPGFAAGVPGVISSRASFIGTALAPGFTVPLRFFPS